MGLPFFRQFSPGLQLLFFLMIHFLGLGLAQAISGFMGIGFWKINVFAHPEAMLNLTDPGIVAFHRMSFIMFALFGFILPALIFRRHMELPDQDYLFIRRGMTWMLCAGIVLVFILSYPVINLLHELNQHIHIPGDTGASLKEIDKQAQEFSMIILFDKNFTVFITNLLVVGFLPALAEELFFRSVILRLFTKMFKGIHAAVWMGALFFSIYHFQFEGFIPRVFMGAVLGYVFVITGNIWYSVWLHFLNNGFIVTLVWLQANGIETQWLDSFGMNNWTRIIAILGFFALVALALYRWKKARHYQMESELMYR